MWTNHIMNRESLESYGIINDKNKHEFSRDERLAATLKEINEKNRRRDFLMETKWKSDESDIDFIDAEYKSFVKPIK